MLRNKKIPAQQKLLYKIVNGETWVKLPSAYYSIPGPHLELVHKLFPPPPPHKKNIRRKRKLPNPSTIPPPLPSKNIMVRPLGVGPKEEKIEQSILSFGQSVVTFLNNRRQNSTGFTRSLM